MKAHRTDVVSFAFGLVFLALSVWWLLARLLGLTLPPVGWFLAGALVLIGLLGLVGALRSAGHPDRNAPAEGPEAETTVAAPYEEGTREWATPRSPDADEWPTDAVTDVPTEALEDQPADPADEPHWSPYLPADEPAAPGRPDAGTEPVTAERPTVSDESGRSTAPPSGGNAGRSGGENRPPG